MRESVFVNIVVAFIDHAALSFCPFSALFSCGGLSQTSVTGFQFLVTPVQRSGLRWRAASYTA